MPLSLLLLVFFLDVASTTLIPSAQIYIPHALYTTFYDDFGQLHVLFELYRVRFCSAVLMTLPFVNMLIQFTGGLGVITIM